MINQSYSPSALFRLITRSDPRHYRMGRTRSDYRHVLNGVHTEITSEGYKFSDFGTCVRNGKKVFVAANIADDFALRKLNSNLSKVYSIIHADRQSTVRQIITLLSERIPFYVIKRDIKDFFESVNRVSLLESIEKDRILCHQSRQHLSMLLKDDLYFREQGLPRGLGVSATLAELQLQKFDQTVRRIPGVYFYARYVDDIIIFSHRPSTEVSPIIESAILSYNLFFNTSSDKKTDTYFDPNSKSGHCSLDFSYLGYRFISVEASKYSIINTRIAAKKINKIKTRLMRAIFQYFKDRRFDLLRDRIKFLTGNYEIKSDKEDRKLMAGIYYNYNLIDQSGEIELKELTNFLQKALTAKSGAFGRKMQSLLSPSQRSELQGYCFLAGFSQQITHKLTRQRLAQINTIWKYG